MSLSTVFEGVDLPGILAGGSFVLVLILIVILAIFLHILHPILARRYDHLLFKKPWFSQAELTLYTAWPLNLIRSIQYMYLFTFPDYLKKRRFKNLDIEIPVSKTTLIISRIYMSLHILLVLIGIVFFVSGAYIYFFVTPYAE